MTRIIPAMTLLVLSACVTTATRSDGTLKPPPATGPATRVALLDLKPAGESSAELAQTLAELVAYELEDTGRFSVMNRTDLAEALKLKGVQQGLGCETERCQADLAKAVDVQQIVTGSLGKLDDQFVLVLRLVDAGEVTVIRQAKDTSPGQERELLAAVQRTSWTIAGLEAHLPEKKSSSRPRSGPTRRSSPEVEAGEGSEDPVGDAVADAAVRGAASIGANAILGGFGSFGNAVADVVAPALTAALETELASSLRKRLDARRRESAAAKGASSN